MDGRVTPGCNCLEMVEMLCYLCYTALIHEQATNYRPRQVKVSTLDPSRGHVSHGAPRPDKDSKNGSRPSRLHPSPRPQRSMKLPTCDSLGLCFKTVWDRCLIPPSQRKPPTRSLQNEIIRAGSVVPGLLELVGLVHLDCQETRQSYGVPCSKYWANR